MKGTPKNVKKSIGIGGLAIAASLTLASSGTANATITQGIFANTSTVVTSCATPKGGGTANGTIITAWTCNGSPSQQWSYSSDGYVKNIASGKCLTPSGGYSGTNGTVLTLWTCTNDLSQRFVEQIGGQMYTEYGGKCITNKGGVLLDGAYLTLWTCYSPRPLSQTWEVF